MNHTNTPLYRTVFGIVVVVCAILIATIIAAPNAYAQEQQWNPTQAGEVTASSDILSLKFERNDDRRSIHEVNDTVFGIRDSVATSRGVGSAVDVQQAIEGISAEIKRIEKMLEIHRQIAEVRAQIAAIATTNTAADTDGSDNRESGTDTNDADTSSATLDTPDVASAFTLLERGGTRCPIHEVNKTMFGIETEGVAVKCGDSDATAG